MNVGLSWSGSNICRVSTFPRQLASTPSLNICAACFFFFVKWRGFHLLMLRTDSTLPLPIWMWNGVLPLNRRATCVFAKWRISFLFLCFLMEPNGIVTHNVPSLLWHFLFFLYFACTLDCHWQPNYPCPHTTTWHTTHLLNPHYPPWKWKMSSVFSLIPGDSSLVKEDFQQIPSPDWYHWHASHFTSPSSTSTPQPILPLYDLPSLPLPLSTLKLEISQTGFPTRSRALIDIATSVLLPTVNATTSPLSHNPSTPPPPPNCLVPNNTSVPTTHPSLWPLPWDLYTSTINTTSTPCQSQPLYPLILTPPTLH